MIALKLVNYLLGVSGGILAVGSSSSVLEVNKATGIVAVSNGSHESLLLAVISVLCGLLTVVLSVFLASYIKHITNLPAHTEPAYTKGTLLVTEATCVARTEGISRRLDDMNDMLETIVEAWKDKHSKKSNTRKKRPS